MPPSCSEMEGVAFQRLPIECVVLDFFTDRGQVLLIISHRIHGTGTFTYMNGCFFYGKLVGN